MKKELSLEQKRADRDLTVLLLLSLLPLTIYLVFNDQMITFAKSSQISIWLRLITILCCQFGLAGLGAATVMIFRKENFQLYGLVKDKILSALLLTTLISLPTLLYLVFYGQWQSYLPFQGMFLTKEVLSSPFPMNIIGYLFIAMVWGFWEGFNYVLIAQKINARYPSKQFWLDYGAISCALVCILIHGMISFDLSTIIEASATFILIYGMLLVRKHTGNAWGCIAVFIFLWNAF